MGYTNLGLAHRAVDRQFTASTCSQHAECQDKQPENGTIYTKIIVYSGSDSTNQCRLSQIVIPLHEWMNENSYIAHKKLPLKTLRVDSDCMSWECERCHSPSFLKLLNFLAWVYHGRGFCALPAHNVSGVCQIPLSFVMNATRENQKWFKLHRQQLQPVSYTHLRAHETG